MFAMHGLPIYVLLLFLVGTAHSVRLGLVFAILSALAGAIAVLQFHAGFFALLVTQAGVFIGACVLWLFASALTPGRALPARVSATHHSAVGSTASGVMSPVVLSAIVVFAIIAAFAAIILLGPPVSGDVVQFFMITGVLGVALVIAFVAPFVSLALGLLRLLGLGGRNGQNGGP